MKKLALVVLIIGVICGSGYVYMSEKLGTKNPVPVPVKSEQPQPQKAETILDLRPKLISKLQQLVKEGSGGLYNLSIKEIEPDLLASTLLVRNAVLLPDSAVLAQMKTNNNLPHDVFKISSDALHIDGINLNDLLSKDKIDLKTIHISNPVITVYNNSKNQKEDNATLYQKIMKLAKRIAVDHIVIEHGTLISSKGKKNLRFNDVAIKLDNLLIDSSTQYDKSRFLFAKNAAISFKDFSLPTPDNLYLFKAATVAINATSHNLVATHVSLIPKWTKKEFEKKLKARQVRYDVAIPQLQLSGVDWWQLLSNESLQAKSIQLNNVTCKVYLDRALPPRIRPLNDFPHQLLQRLPMAVHVNQLRVNNAKLSYEEYSPVTKKTGTIYFRNLNINVANLTNMKEVMLQNKRTTLAASGLLMNKIPIKANFVFDLSKVKIGAFTTDISISGFTNDDINPIAEPIGSFTIKRGKLKKGSAHIQGNNQHAIGKVLMLYNDLHITPLKAGTDSGELKKKHVTSLIANKLLIKDNNPSGNETPRSPDGEHDRVEGSDLFNLVWKTMLVGILKTIGLPTKLADPKQ